MRHSSHHRQRAAFTISNKSIQGQFPTSDIINHTVIQHSTAKNLAEGKSRCESWLSPFAPFIFFSPLFFWFWRFQCPLLALVSPLFTSLFTYSLSYSISLLFLRRRCCGRWLFRQATLHLVCELVTRAATALKAALSGQNLFYLALALVASFHVHEVEKGLDRVCTYESNIQFGSFCADSVL